MITTRSFAVLGASLAAGLAIFGLQIGHAVRRGREFDRYFTARGLSEREVTATLAVWPLYFSVFAQELPALKTEMENTRQIVDRFLRAHDIPAEDVTVGLPGLVDNLDNNYGQTNLDLPRYKGIGTLVVRSPKVELVKRAIQEVDALLAQGVRIGAGGYHNVEGTRFVFEGVNELKPALIEEATANARAAAAKFAQDSRAKVGAIRRATQGALEIDQRDAASPEKKIVRVVTTVEFFIE